MARRIDEEVLRVLSAAACEGPRLRLTGQLDRALYVATNTVLEALGGKWDRQAKAHVFAEDAEGRIEGALLTGTYARPDDFGFFPTPPALVARLLELAEIAPGMRVLEPSAGHGAIADAIYDLTGERPRLVELLPANCDVLRAKGYGDVLGAGDFLGVPADAWLPFDRIVMNPPFARQQDLAHVRHAWELLAPGGRLVAIMALGFTFRQDRNSASFRTRVCCYGRWERNAPDAFRSSGTDVQTVTVVLDKPADQPTGRRDAERAA